MIRSHPAQPAFIGGEMSPLILGRSDTERFLVGGGTVENFIARHQGPLVRRLGTQRLHFTSTPYARLVNFEYSRTDAELIQFGGGTIIIGTQVGDGIGGSGSTDDGDGPPIIPPGP